MSNNKWIKFDPDDIDNIPVGTYYAYGGVAPDGRDAFISGKVALMTVFKISVGQLACCDGLMIFDLPYMPTHIAPFDVDALISDVPGLEE